MNFKTLTIEIRFTTLTGSKRPWEIWGTTEVSSKIFSSCGSLKAAEKSCKEYLALYAKWHPEIAVTLTPYSA